MNIIDVVFLLIVLAAGIVGFKRGVFKEIVMTIGFLLVLVISFKLKDPIANWMSFNLPFFKLKGISSLNIILYQGIAFFITASLIMIIFRIVLKLTGIFEKILKFTIVLGIPSKILGFLVGLVEGYIIMFFVIFFLNQPYLNVGIMNDSKIKDNVLNSSPVLTNIVKNTNDAVNEIYVLQKGYIESEDKEVYNEGIINILLKYNIVSDEYINKLKSINKI